LAIGSGRVGGLQNVFGDDNESFRQAKNIDLVLKELPIALGQFVGNGQISGDTQPSGEKFRNLLENQILQNNQNIDLSNFSALLNGISAEFSGIETEKIIDGLKNPLEFGKSLIVSLSFFEKAIEQTGKAFQEAGQSLSNLNQKLTQSSLAIIESEQKSRQIEFDGANTLERLRNPFATTNVGAARDLFNNNLGGLIGNTNPDDISQKIISNVNKSTDIQNQINKFNEGGFGVNDPRVRDLTKEFSDLNLETIKLKKGLDLLTDASNRTAAIQSRLGELRQGRNDATNFGEKLLTASGSERSQLFRGSILTRLAARQGNLNNTTVKQRESIFSFLGNLGSANIADGKGGFIQANKLKQNLTQNTLPGLVPQQFAKEEESLILEAAKIYEQAAKIQKTATDIDIAQRNKFATAIDNFPNKLQTVLDKINQQALNAGTQQELFSVQKQLGEKITLRNDLSNNFRIGAFTNQGVTNVLKNKDQIEKDAKFVSNKGFNTTFLDSINVESLSGGLFDGKLRGTDRLNKFDTKAEIAKINKDKFGGKLNEDELFNTVSTANRIRSDNPGAFKRDFGFTTFTEIFVAAIKKQAEKINPGEVSQAEQRIKGFGLNPGDLANLDKDNKLPTFFAQLQKINEAAGQGRAVAQLAIDIETLTKKAAELSLQVGQQPLGLGALGGGITQFKASGGEIFKKKGSDTVPAMLTPGEFVVNKQSAQKNKDLLARINSNKTQYFADGGIVAQQKKKIEELDKKAFAEQERNRKSLEAEKNNNKGIGNAFASRNAANPFNNQVNIKKPPQQLSQRQDAERLRAIKQRRLENESAESGLPVQELKRREEEDKKINYINQRASEGFTDPTTEKIKNKILSERKAREEKGFGKPQEQAQQQQQEKQLFAGRGNGLAQAVRAKEAGESNPNATANYSDLSKSLDASFTKFNDTVSKLGNIISKFPTNITGEFNHNVNVNINGAEVFKELTPSIQTMIVKTTGEMINTYLAQVAPEAPKVQVPKANK
jgi:hypothetical protein